MILLQAQQVARRFGGDYLFQNAQLEVQNNARVALVGPNGVGKSTFLKIIAGIDPPDEGQVIYGKGVRIAYMAQDSGLDSERTIYDEMLTVFAPLQKLEQHIHDLEQQISAPDANQSSPAYQQLLSQYDQAQHDFSARNGYGYEAEIRSVLHGFQFDEPTYQKPIHTLSGGEKSRLALAKLLLEKNDVLILDEPTNHLDIDTLTWLENYLKGYQGALLMVSHDRYFLDHVVNETYELSSRGTEHYNGNYTTFLKQKQARLDQEWKAYEKQQAEIQKLQTFVDKNIVRASTTKQAQSRRKQLEKMDKLEKPKSGTNEIRLQFKVDHPSGNDVLKVTNAAIGYSPDHIMAEPINLDVQKGDVQAIIGPNGIGKSTLLKSILGKIPFMKGSAKIGSGVQIGYYDQEQQQLHRNKDILHEVWDEHPTMPERDIRSILGSFLFRGDDVLKPVANLSGGEKARLALTKLALDHDNFLVLDEPTNHLDIDSKEVLEQALLDFDGTILFVSHDRYFINKIATSIVVVSEHGSKRYLGDYDYYLDKHAEEQEFAAQKAAGQQPASEAPQKSAQDNYQASKTQQREERKLRREIDKLEQQLTDLEQQSQQLQEQMAQPDVYSDVAKVKDLQDQLEAANAESEKIETQWEEKSLALEDMMAQ
ncbi:hypothetical protein IV38_GL002085 [Lactobacillus selangorensis]|uniref:ABC transporter domain-containing protein n=1 Tax=Lactobacillus selangorensis TaxID=81857 RepID=A0A0R2FFN8_9LACO|nr:ABC-F family ATP-binding cassette domain-containing protein [Lactobacillus selangorensis]KRN27433.1 hypothetical protein IV38_GL002085 [Lactobacillus selangorensis]KRN31370.1 hypothetical protein IV40_GL001365 [Lactobacillus selangorensis]